MNAGRDVERLIAHWLVEEASARSPDRILDSTRRAVHRTRQRRFAATWREPMYISPVRLAGMAAVLVAAVVGGAWIGRATAPTGVGSPTPSPTATPTAAPFQSPGAELDAYKVARNAICARYEGNVGPLRPMLPGLYDVGTSPSARVEAIGALTSIVTQLEAMAGELLVLAASPEISADHVRSVARHEDMNSLIRQELVALAADDLAGAQALDLATEPLDADIGAFEAQYDLANCP